MFSRLLRLPPPCTEYTVHRGVRVPMRDGVELIADHYVPATTTPKGTLLVRGPYGRTGLAALTMAAIPAARGYHVLLQSVRGTFGSGGAFAPVVQEVADGADTVAWLRRQPWFTGSLATIGGSYLGFTQWALLRDPAPEMKAAIVTVAPHDFHTAFWGTGAFSLNDSLGWSDFVAHQEDPHRIRSVLRAFRAGQLLAQAADELPLGQAGRALLGAGAPWYESWIEHPDQNDPFWLQYSATDALDRIQIPVLLMSGWQDLFLEQTLAQYQRLTERGVTTALTVGPWNHNQMTVTAAATIIRESLAWLDTHLTGNRGSVPRWVRAYVNGHGWTDLPRWPPPFPERVLYLQPGRRLADTPPAATAPASSFTFNPADPTPTVGGQLLSADGGYRDDTRLAQRADVLTYTGNELAEDLYVVGSPVVELSHSCDNPHHDLFVRVSEVNAKGRSRNVSDGFIRRTSDSGIARIELAAVAHRFRAGSRIRVIVAGGSHPRFARNLGTGEPPLTGRRLASATHTVHHGEGGISRVVLPAGQLPPSTD